MSFLFDVSANNQQDFSMTANHTKRETSDENENFPDSQDLDPTTGEVASSTIVKAEKSPSNSLRPGRTLLGLGIFALLTIAIVAVTNHLKPSGSMAGMEGMEGMDHGDMSHDEMMAVDGSFNPNPVRVETVKPQVLEASVSYTGTIKPYEEIMVYPRVAGQLTNYSVYPDRKSVV